MEHSTTLEELIMLCGNRFGDLRLYTNQGLKQRWCAKGAAGIPCVKGETAYEAMVNLFFELETDQYKEYYKKIYN